MKRLFGLLAFVLTCITAWGQDYTNLITNPSFETSDMTGWKYNGVWTQGNDVFKQKTGTTYCEKWTGRGGYVDNAYMTQVVKGLPVGTYTLSAEVQNIQEDTPAVAQQGVYLVADNNKTLCTIAGTYSVKFSTVTGEVTIGMLIEGCTGNYVCIDNFRITFESLDLSVAHEGLQKLIEEAQGVNKHVSGFAAQTELDEAIAQAQAQLGVSTEEGLQATCERLTKALADYPYGIASEDNPCPMNDFVVNGDFEDGLSGWINKGGMVSQGNKLFTAVNGNVYCEKWTWAGNQLVDVNIYQQIKDLPNGRYRLVAAAQNKLQKDGASANQKGAYIYGDNTQVEVGVAADYTVNFTAIEKQVAIGFKTIKCTGNWLSCDNFRLYYMGTSDEIIAKEKNSRLAYADSLAALPMDETVLNTLTAARSALANATDDAMPQAAITLREACVEAEESIERTAFAYNIEHATGTKPTVKTGNNVIGDYIARGSTVALGRSIVSGSNIIERGYCWSSINTEPTVLDNRSSESFDYNGSPIYRMKDLEPSTVYYVRAYAMTSGYAVGYGKVKKIITLPKGTCGYSYNWGADAEANERINNALAEGVEYFNNCTSIQGFWVNCSYGSGTPTADCSYGGSMRVGPNASYQRTGTIQHEMTHGVGVGTIGRWSDGNLHNGSWFGERANKVAQFFDNNTATTMAGDGMHMWPYGINGAQEDTGSPMLYTANAMIVQGMHEDGLTATWSSGNATPAWVFENADDVKYYIKNEGMGNTTGYLTENSSHNLVLTDISGEDVVKDDAYAWYITFNPKKQLYQFRNAKTGNYITYTSSMLKTVSRTNPTTAEDIQVMNSRGEVTLKNGNFKYTDHSYWMFYPQNSQTPPTLSCSTAGKVSTASFNLASSATAQRWFFLTEQQVENVSKVTEAVLNQELVDMIAAAKAVLATPHTAASDTTDISLSKAIETAEEQLAVLTKYAELTTATSDLREATINFVGNTVVLDENVPYDITFVLKNADISGTESWEGDVFTYSNSCGEFYETKFDMNQTTVSKLPKGDYRFECQAFQRPGSANDSATLTNSVSASIYARSKSTRINHITVDSQSKSLGVTEKKMDGKYVPDNMAAARAYFDKGLYHNSIDFNMITKTTAKMGLKCTVTANAYYWVCFDNFSLKAFGNSAVTAIEGVEQSAEQPVQYYTIDGIRLSSAPRKGVYIMRKGNVTAKCIAK